MYDAGKCGVFDNEADSLVTAIEYESLTFLKRTVEDSVAMVLFSFSKDGLEGMMTVLVRTTRRWRYYFRKNRK